MSAKNGPRRAEGAAPGFSRRELAAVCLLAFLADALFAAKAFHIDEPFFLAPVPQILRDPRHPLAFALNWVGSSQPASGIFNHSLLTSYFLAPAELVGRGSEALTRLACLPVDLAAAAALYLLASRFLARPLWPTLIVLAGPAWFLGMPLLMAEKWIVCFSLLSVCALLSALDDETPAAYWLSALLISLSVVLKHTAVFLLAPLAAVQWRRGVPPRRIAGYLLAAALPVVLDAFWLEPHRLRVTWELAARVDGSFFAKIHRLRALAAFPAGCGVAVALWPFARLSSPPARVRAVALGALAASAALFSPFLDFPGLPVGAFDRLLGVFFACGTIAAVCRLLERGSRRLPGWWLWTPWVLAGLATAGLNWFVSARAVLLFLPALILAGAERLESELAPRTLETFWRIAFAGTLLLSVGLARVDAHFADAQRDFARSVKSEFIDRGRKVWFTGHWGFQYYMERAGAFALDSDRGGWAEVRPGDAAAIPLVNTGQIVPAAGARADIRETRVEEAIPLRLMGAEGRQAGFYASPFGFLPYTVSRAPLDVFTTVVAL